MKSISYLFLSSALLIGAVSCQKDGLPLSSKSAWITQCVVTGGGRNTINEPTKFQYLLKYTVSASLADLDGVEEWGVYSMDDNKHNEYAFSEVSKSGTKNMNLYVKNSLFHEDSNKRYVETPYKLGVYVKRRGNNGELKTYYGKQETFNFYYNFTSPPSLTFSNPIIISTEEVDTEKGKQYKTEYSCYVTVTGSLDIDYLEEKVSANRKWTDIDPDLYLVDGTHYRTYTAHYYLDTGIDFSHWMVIHCLDGKEIESSNWLNLSGNPTMSKIEVSQTERKLESDNTLVLLQPNDLILE